MPEINRGTALSEKQCRVIIRKVTWVGLIFNLLLAAGKFLAGYFGNSQAVLADSIHSLSDSTTDIAILIGSTFWSKPPDENHPYGHRRIETFVTLFIGIVLILVAVGLSLEALGNIREKHNETPKIVAMVAALISIVVKEFLYRWTHTAGEKVRSSALQANAWHHRSDAMSSLPAAIAVGVAIILPEWTFIDHVGAVVVSMFILQAALKIMLPALNELMAGGASKQVCDDIISFASKVEGVREVHGLRTRFVGARLHIDVHVVVDGDMSVWQGHAISDNVSDTILSEVPEVIDVVVHIDPDEKQKERQSRDNNETD